MALPSVQNSVFVVFVVLMCLQMSSNVGDGPNAVGMWMPELYRDSIVTKSSLVGMYLVKIYSSGGSYRPGFWCSAAYKGFVKGSTVSSVFCVGEQVVSVACLDNIVFSSVSLLG